jgi:hypothetical protein
MMGAGTIGVYKFADVIPSAKFGLEQVRWHCVIYGSFCDENQEMNLINTISVIRIHNSSYSCLSAPFISIVT